MKCKQNAFVSTPSQEGVSKAAKLSFLSVPTGKSVGSKFCNFLVNLPESNPLPVCLFILLLPGLFKLTEVLED
jgi:hypothetical protein